MSGIYIVRRDGAIALATVDGTEEFFSDLWGALDAYYPHASEMIDESMILPLDAEYDWDERFKPGEDYYLRDWLMEWNAQAIEVSGFQIRVLREFRGEPSKRAAIEKASDWLELNVVGHGFDESEQDLRVRIGGEDVWSWLEAIGEFPKGTITSRSARKTASKRTTAKRPAARKTAKRTTATKRKTTTRKPAAKRRATKGARR